MGTNIFLHLSTEMDNFCAFLMRSQGTSKETRKAQLTKTFGFYVLGPKVIPEVRDNREIRENYLLPLLGLATQRRRWWRGVVWIALTRVH